MSTVSDNDVTGAEVFQITEAGIMKWALSVTMFETVRIC